MSTVMVITPIIIANWPAITAAVAAAVGTMGFAAAQEAESLDRARTSSTNREEIDVEDSDILQAAAGTAEEIVVERERRPRHLQPRRPRTVEALPRRRRAVEGRSSASSARN